MDTSSVMANDFLVKYRNISFKLKKRFLRKPNVAEASEEFAQLARELIDGEAWAQAGLCCLAVARCEQTLANPSTEISAIIQSARHFLKAEMVCAQLHTPSFSEHLMASISCYQHAQRLYIDQQKPVLSAALGLELGQALMSLNRPSEALIHLCQAADLLTTSTFDLLTCLEFIAQCKIDLGDLDGALTVFTQMTRITEEHAGQWRTRAHQDIFAKCEISALLLLLILQPLSQQTKPPHALLLEKYSWTSTDDNKPNVPYEDPEVLVLLQSLVLACQGRDTVALSALSESLTPLLDVLHLHLLHILVKEMKRGIS